MSPDTLTLRQAIGSRFPRVLWKAGEERGEETFVVEAEALQGLVGFLRAEQGFDVLTDLTAVDRLGHTPRFEAVYHLHNRAAGRRLRLKVPLPEEAPRVSTLTGEFAAADWLEREAWDMFGVVFEGHPDLRRLLLYEGFEGHPLRKDYPKKRRQPRIGPGSRPQTAFDREPSLAERLSPRLRAAGTAASQIVYLNMGPSHPAMHGVVRIVLALEGETILASDVEIGYMHRAFEKEAETHTYTQVIPYTDRLDYVSPLINNVGYVLAVEKLFGVETPERCRYIRVVVSEISRLCDHLTCIGALAMELGAFTVFLYMMKAREYLYDLVELVTGARLTTCYTRIGGVKADLPPDFSGRCEAAFREVERVLGESHRLLTRNRIFCDRTQGVGRITADEALSYGFTGPCLRATGLAYDVRKAEPYLVYDRFDFDVPVGSRGDTYDRYLVRMTEMEQSMRIVRQALRDLPPGPVCVADRRMVLPPKEEVTATIEGLMNHFKLIMSGHGIRPPAGEVYQAVEGANGELGFYVVSDGTDVPLRVRVRPPCFFLVAALSRLIRGEMVADVVPIFGSLNMVAGELDR